MDEPEEDRKPQDERTDTRSRTPSGVPERALQAYSRLWQPEAWLRRLAYVELRAFAGDDWIKRINVAELPQKADKRLTHMPTPETDPLSFVQFSELRRVLRDNWNLFDQYLPPKKLWEAKLEEIELIRHRVAHFSYGARR